MSRMDSVALSAQSAKGTAQETAEYTIPVESADATESGESLELEETIALPFPTRVEKGTHYFEVPLTLAPRPASLPRILSAFFGAPSTELEDGASGAYRHTFSAAALEALVWHSILVNRADPSPAITDLYFDALGNEFTLKVEPDGYLMLEATFFALALDAEQSAPVSPVVDFTERFTFKDCTAYLNVEGAGEAEVKVGAFALTYSTNLVTDIKVLGQRALWDLPANNRTAEVTFTTREDLAEHYRRALEDNPEAVSIRLNAVGAEIESGFPLEIDVTIPLTEYLTAPAPVNAGEYLTGVEVTARAAYSPDDAEFVQIDVVNDVADYS